MLKSKIANRGGEEKREEEVKGRETQERRVTYREERNVNRES